jgi:methylase of polypeptide subunit release factors
MDMGSGVGLISLLSCYRDWGTLSVDREPLALKNLRKNLVLNGFNAKLLLSDLFEGIPRSFLGSFDLITFNPPYLGDLSDHNDRRTDLPLVGGAYGFEVSEKFLRGSVDFLKPDGRIILLGYEKWIDLMDISSTDLVMERSEMISRDIDGERFSVFNFKRNPSPGSSRNIIS